MIDRLKVPGSSGLRLPTVFYMCYASDWFSPEGVWKLLLSEVSLHLLLESELRPIINKIFLIVAIKVHR